MDLKCPKYCSLKANLSAHWDRGRFSGTAILCRKFILSVYRPLELKRQGVVAPMGKLLLEYGNIFTSDTGSSGGGVTQLPGNPTRNNRQAENGIEIASGFMI
ncbi:hypothetical protein N7524_011857 [Penicillium chrysogenum]|nr:hypothetical protein N7524_011857 [Penicillium chrysogenum]